MEEGLEVLRKELDEGKRVNKTTHEHKQLGGNQLHVGTHVGEEGSCF